MTPIVDTMRNYANDGALAFHTPGHKQGLGAHSLLKELITIEGLRREVSLMEELDDLHDPRTCIKEAQRLAAKLWNADEVFFMVNGTTSAVQAMILSILSPNDLVLVPRNAHRSVMSGLILSGAQPVFLSPEFDINFGISLNLTLNTIKLAVDKYPKAKALIIVSPNYYGVSANLSKIASFLHERNILLLVDEAHGAHLQFSDKLPTSAMDSGADLSAQSTHKLLGSLTQTSMLMFKSKFVDINRVKKVTSLLQSTSPNYLLLASLDIARFQMEEAGRILIERAIKLSEYLCGEINKISGLKCLTYVDNFEIDITKITVNVSALGITGIEAEKILRHKYKVQCELSDLNNLLFLITIADTEVEINKLIDALHKLSKEKFKSSNVVAINDLHIDKIIEPVLTPREAFYSSTEAVKLKDSVGKICAEEVTFYPPGIPILCPGELITYEVVEQITNMKKVGRRIVGAVDNTLENIQIIDNSF